MIRTESEYQEAIRRFKQDRDVAAQMREAMTAQGLTPEQVETAMEPTMSYQAQLTEEMEWYENVCRGNIQPPTRLTDLGRVLIALRISKGLKQYELAKLLGVSEAVVSRDERNEYHGITLERAQKILDALQATITATVGTSPGSTRLSFAHEPVPLEEVTGTIGGRAGFSESDDNSPVASGLTI